MRCRVLCLSAALSWAVACSSDTAPIQSPPPPAPTIAVTASSGSASVTQDFADTISISVTRGGGYAGTVSLSLDGAPTGVSGTFASSSLDATTTSTKLVLAVSAAAVPGTYPLTIHATGTGVAAQTSSVALTVVAPKNNVSFQFCTGGAPVFFASQDGSGPWTNVSADASGKFTFTITGKGAIAFVTAAGTRFSTRIEYATRTELQQESAACLVPSGTASMTGTVAGLGTGESATVLLGQGLALSSANGSFSVFGVPLGIHDLIASEIPNGSAGFTPKKIILRRNVTAAANGVITPLDFGSAESFAPATANAIVLNPGSDIVGVLPTYYTGNSGGRMWLQNGFTLNTIAAKVYAGIPLAQQKDGDFQGLAVEGATQVGSAIVATRMVTSFFTTIVDKNVTLGPLANPASVSIASASPTVLLSAQWAGQKEYGQYFTASFTQTGATGNSAFIFASAGYFGDISSVTLAMPNLSSVSGWSNAYGLTTGALVNWSVGGFSADFPIDRISSLSTSPFSPPPSAQPGGTLMTGSRTGSLTP
jgi:hypothetical protein